MSAMDCNENSGALSDAEAFEAEVQFNERFLAHCETIAEHARSIREGLLGRAYVEAVRRRGKGNVLSGNGAEEPDLPVLTVDVAKRTITLRDVTYPVTERQAAVVEKLLKARGSFLTGEDLRNQRGSAERPDRIIKGLPPLIRELIKSRPGRDGGHCIVVPVE